MVLGKLYRLYHKTDENGVYSILLENKNDRSETLLFESGAICVLSAQETESIKPLYHILMDVYGCLGVFNINLPKNQNYMYLVCISSCVSIGKIRKHEIFCINETTFFSLHAHQADLDRIQDVRKILNSSTFYFTWAPDDDPMEKFDLTICSQRAERANRSDNRFFWNRLLYIHLKSFFVNTDKWLLKIMCGSVCLNTVYVGHQQAKACLISRLSCERAGTRFNVRGVNDSGHVANFVETEQVIFVDNNVASYILIRGSIPLFWEQTGVQVGAHRLRLSRASTISHPAFERHLAMIQYLYGKQVIINLVGSNQEGEIFIGNKYCQQHEKSHFSQDIPYIAFDYHSYCARGKEENLKLILQKQIQQYIDEFGFYYALEDGQKGYQTGTFRINCIDCLDRTNRVQTFLGLEVLKKQLKVLGLDEKPTCVNRFNELYKSMWQVNGDQISRIYTGTGALEGKSKLRDGTKSVARTIQNNLLDNSKQEAFDILLSGKPSVMSDFEKFRSLLPSQYLHLPSSLLWETCNRHFEFTSIKKIKVAVGTWNVNGGKHFNNIIYNKTDPLSDWLFDANKNGRNRANQVNILDMSLDQSLNDLNANTPDLFAIGFEEIVDLSAQNIVAADTTAQEEWRVELKKIMERYGNYQLVNCTQLVGVCLFLYVKQEHVRFVRDVACDQVKTGLGGATGNKGGVGIRLRLYNSTLCFICSHFAAGQHQVNERNSDFNEISRKMFNSIGKRIDSHDYVFWCGDFNYRIDLPNEECKELIREKNWPKLLEHDQLRCQQKEKKVFKKYSEGEIDFAPTYKYDNNSDEYDTSEKARVPAWTDRVLFRKFQPTRLEEIQHDQLDNGEIIFYGRAELKTSDHRPVIAEFMIETLIVDPEKLQRVFRDVIEKAGPSDATVVIKEAANHYGTEAENPFDGKYIEELQRRLNEIGTIVLAQKVDHQQLSVTFRDGTEALKLYQIGTIDVFDKKFQVTLKTPNWIELFEENINYGINNTAVPLVENTVKVDVDELDDQDLLKAVSPTGNDQTVQEKLINARIVSQQPARPPPPQAQDKERNKVAPSRPAPPPPSKTNQQDSVQKKLDPKLSIDELLNGSLNGTFDDEIKEQFNSGGGSSSFPSSITPSTIPPVSTSYPSTQINHGVEYESDDNDEDDEEGEGDEDYEIPSMPAPDLPPPSVNVTSRMPPKVPPPPPANIPPPIPSRRNAPEIPPRKN